MPRRTSNPCSVLDPLFSRAVHHQFNELGRLPRRVQLGSVESSQPKRRIDSGADVANMWPTVWRLVSRMETQRTEFGLIHFYFLSEDYDRA